MGFNLASTVEGNPEAAQAVYDRFEQALNLLLPGSAYHSRYHNAGSIGLALAVARDHVLQGSYNPLHPDTLKRLSFIADNQAARPEAWRPLEGDPEWLGAPVPEGMGRFTAFALAKLCNLSSYPLRKSSHRVEGINLGPGMVGFAGGQRLAGSLIAPSGLWEVHDHAVGRAFAHEVYVNDDGRSADDVAAALEPVFDGIKASHFDQEAAELSRQEVSYLLRGIDPYLQRTFPTN